MGEPNLKLEEAPASQEAPESGERLKTPENVEAEKPQEAIDKLATQTSQEISSVSDLIKGMEDPDLNAEVQNSEALALKKAQEEAKKAQEAVSGEPIVPQRIIDITAESKAVVSKVESSLIQPEALIQNAPEASNDNAQPVPAEAPIQPQKIIDINADSRVVVGKEESKPVQTAEVIPQSPVAQADAVPAEVAEPIKPDRVIDITAEKRVIVTEGENAEAVELPYRKQEVPELILANLPKEHSSIDELLASKQDELVQLEAKKNVDSTELENISISVAGDEIKMFEKLKERDSIAEEISGKEDALQGLDEEIFNLEKANPNDPKLQEMKTQRSVTEKALKASREYLIQADAAIVAIDRLVSKNKAEQRRLEAIKLEHEKALKNDQAEGKLPQFMKDGAEAAGLGALLGATKLGGVDKGLKWLFKYTGDEWLSGNVKRFLNWISFGNEKEKPPSSHEDSDSE